jgi:hypothetical protein
VNWTDPIAVVVEVGRDLEAARLCCCQYAIEIMHTLQQEQQDGT